MIVDTEPCTYCVRGWINPSIEGNYEDPCPKCDGDMVIPVERDEP